jgi:cysteine dioxygenase
MVTDGGVRCLPVEAVISELEAIEPAEFTLKNIDQYLTGLLLDQKSLLPYLHFKTGGYTRNLIVKNQLFEALILCWDVGQKTPVHNHRGQLGWMSVQQGMLSIRNYKRLDCSGACHLRQRWSRLQLLSEVPIAGVGFVAHVSDHETIHQIVNDARFQQRAVSLHIYSRPFDSCVIYDVEGQTCQDKQLANYSEGGQLLEGSRPGQPPRCEPILSSYERPFEGAGI